MSTKVSDEFYHAFCHSGSLVIDCEYCGRTFFGSRCGDYDDGEYERLTAKAREQPEKYIKVEGDSSHWFAFNGKQCVIGCPCESDVKLEALIWRNRHRIVEFLKTKTDRIAKDVLAEQKAVTAIEPPQ